MSAENVPNSPASSDGLVDFVPLLKWREPQETGDKLRELLPVARESGDVTYLVQLLSQIARSHSIQRQFDQAHQILDEAEGLLDEVRAVARVRYLLERGRTFNSAGKKAQARELFLQAYGLGARIGEEYLTVDAAHMMNIAAEPDRALDWGHKAIAAAEAATDPRARGWLGALYNNIGWSHHDLGQFEQALTVFKKGVEWRRAQEGQERELRIAEWTVGRTLRSLERPKEALPIQQRLLKEWKAAGSEDGYVYEELGELLLVLDRGDEARPHFTRAWELLKEDGWLVENEGPRLERLKALGEGRDPSTSTGKE